MSADERPAVPDTSLEQDADELYEHAPCALLSTRPDGTIVRANRTLLDLIGASHEQTLNTRFQGLLTIGSRIYYETHFAPLLQMQGFVNEIALELRRADGRVLPVVASARQFRDADDVASINRLALFDSTDRRRYEQELLAERKRAEQAVKELSEADRRRNEFIAMLAHELRNPLAPIRSAVEVLRRIEPSKEVAVKTTDMMHRQVTHMIRLVDDLMDVSRLGQDRFTLKRVPLDLASLVHHAVEASDVQFQNAGVSLSASVPDRAIYVEGDATRLLQILGNLLNNAVKFTPRGGAVSLTLERADHEALIRIRDNGIGIDQKDLSRVFDLFVQADTSLERREGLGIGLMLAKSLAERHGGRIAIDSAGLGHGTELRVYLPMLTDALTSVSRTFGPAAPEQAVLPRRVLVVDDNHDSADVLALLLELSGHTVRVAHDGLNAVDICADFQPDLVVLDIGLPGLNGYEAAKRIRRQTGRQPVLVALSGWGQDEDRVRSSAAGFDSHLVKPVDHGVLLLLLANLPVSE